MVGVKVLYFYHELSYTVVKFTHDSRIANTVLGLVQNYYCSMHVVKIRMLKYWTCTFASCGVFI